MRRLLVFLALICIFAAAVAVAAFKAQRLSNIAKIREIWARNFIAQDEPRLQGDPEAEENLEEVIAQNPKLVGHLYYRRGLSRERANDHDRAVADFTKAIGLDPAESSFFDARGAAHEAKQEHDPAIADYSKAIELNPEFYEAFCRRGIAEANNDQYDLALADYNQAIKIGPKYAPPYYYRAVAYEVTDNITESIANYSEYIKLEPEDPPGYLARAYAYIIDSQYEMAIIDERKIVQIGKNDLQAIYFLGYLQFSLGKFQDAASNFERRMESKENTYAMIMKFLARSRLGESALPELQTRIANLKTKAWPYSVAELYLGVRSPNDILDEAVKLDESCDAQVFIGEWDVLKDDRKGAAAAFEAAMQLCKAQVANRAIASAELKRLSVK